MIGIGPDRPGDLSFMLSVWTQHAMSQVEHTAHGHHGTDTVSCLRQTLQAQDVKDSEHNLNHIFLSLSMKNATQVQQRIIITIYYCY